MMRKAKDKKTVSVHVLCSPAEHAALTAAAKAAHLSLGAWARSTLLKIAAAGAALLAIGCGRALPSVGSDDGGLPDALSAALFDLKSPPDLTRSDSEPDLGQRPDLLDFTRCGRVGEVCCEPSNAGCVDGTVCCASDLICRAAADCR